MHPELERYARICDAVALLFQPYAEVVLHDVASETVVYIAGTFSKRVLGEPSLLDQVSFGPGETTIGPYEKINWDGRRIKSVSVVLTADEGPVGVLCINVDVSHFQRRPRRAQRPCQRAGSGGAASPSLQGRLARADQRIRPAMDAFARAAGDVPDARSEAGAGRRPVQAGSLRRT